LITNIYYKKPTWNTNLYFFNITQLKKFFYNTSVHFNMCFFCIPRSFLVTNVCNQENTLCSPCIIILCVLLAEPYVITNTFTDMNNVKLGNFYFDAFAWLQNRSSIPHTADVSVLSVESRSNLTSINFPAQGVLEVNGPQLVFDSFCLVQNIPQWWN